MKLRCVIEDSRTEGIVSDTIYNVMEETVYDDSIIFKLCYPECTWFYMQVKHTELKDANNWEIIRTYDDEDGEGEYTYKQSITLINE